jgi:hypothetical protein
MLPSDLYSKWNEEYKLYEEIRSQNDGKKEPEIVQTEQQESSTV